MRHNPKKNKNRKAPGHMHWAARFVIKYGTLFSLLQLIIGFLFSPGSFYAISFCQSAVYSFAVSVVGGLLFDVVAVRRGMRE